MKFGLWTQYGALNSKPIFTALEKGITALGHQVAFNTDDCDIPVIWSVLWNGRMAPNEQIFKTARSQGKDVLVLEVGGLIRGTTWKVGLNGINGEANFGPKGNNFHRCAKLGISLDPWNIFGEDIIICGQHDKSHQWRDMPPMAKWLDDIISQIRRISSRRIIWSPHPRCPVGGIEHEFENVVREQPIKIKGSYDDFDFKTDNAFAVINWSSNPATQAMIEGVPVFTGPHSLAWPVANQNLDTITLPIRPDRTQWFNDLAYTEWTIDEISEGLPLKHLTF